MDESLNVRNTKEFFNREVTPISNSILSKTKIKSNKFYATFFYLFYNVEYLPDQLQHASCVTLYKKEKRNIMEENSANFLIGFFGKRSFEQELFSLLRGQFVLLSCIFSYKINCPFVAYVLCYVPQKREEKYHGRKFENFQIGFFEKAELRMAIVYFTFSTYFCAQNNLLAKRTARFVKEKNGIS